MTLFEEFVGYEAMMGSSWMLPIMVLFFLMLLSLKKKRISPKILFYVVCVGSILIAILRYVTGKPFPTALCLLMCVGMIGFMQKKSGILCNEHLVKIILVFEITLFVASMLSYGNKVYWYFIAYNLGFLAFFLFQKQELSLKLFDKLGELGFTFFLGACIPINAIALFYPSIMDWNCFLLAITQFILAYVFSYVITRWVEKPMLRLGKQLEKRLL